MTQNFAEFLKAEEQATKHASDVIEHTLTVFTWIVGVVGGLLLAGAALLGWAIAHWSRASRTDIQKEVKEQLVERVTEAIESESKQTQRRITQLSKEADELTSQLNDAKNRVKSTENTLGEQQDTINKLVVLTIGRFPYAYLKSIYDQTTGSDTSQEFLWQDQPSFKREMGFLIDHGYFENINLEGFADHQNILDKLLITEAGKLYVTLRESAA